MVVLAAHERTAIDGAYSRDDHDTATGSNAACDIHGTGNASAGNAARISTGSGGSDNSAVNQKGPSAMAGFPSFVSFKAGCRRR